MAIKSKNSSAHEADFLTPSEAADVLTIQRVLSRVGSYADAKRWEEHSRLFTQDVTVDFGGVKPSQVLSAQDLETWGKTTYLGVRTQHMFTNQDVILDGDRATVTSYGRALHERTATGESWMIYARYEHDLLRTADGWRVSRLFMEPTWQTGEPNVLG